MTDDEIVEVMRPYLDHADGGYACDTAPEDVAAAGRALIAQAQAAPEAEPVGEVRCDGDSIWQVDGDPAVWRSLGEGAKLYTHPAPAQPSAVPIQLQGDAIDETFRRLEAMPADEFCDRAMALSGCTGPHPRQPDAGGLVEALELYSLTLTGNDAHDYAEFGSFAVAREKARRAALAAYRAQQGKEDGDV